MPLGMLSRRPNRRRAERIRLTRPLVCRFGTFGAVLIDISVLGARIEHYVRFERGFQKPLRLTFSGEEIAVPCEVVSCRVDRFIPGKEGLTVYRSGLKFLDEHSDEVEKVKKLISKHVAGTLVEQVANAKGFRPPEKGDMPIFRGGMLTSNAYDPDRAQKDEALLPGSALARQTGYIRYSFDSNRWIRKWTLEPGQPSDGFTVSANESQDQIEALCDLYRSSDADGRRFIRMLAELSVEQQIANK